MVKEETDTALVYIYYDFRRHNRELTTLFENIWICRDLSEAEVDQLDKELDARRVKLSAVQINGLVEREFTDGTLQPIVIVIDALDECTEAQRVALLDHVSRSCPWTNLLITSRVLGSDLDRLEDIRIQRIISTDIDINAYITQRITGSPRLNEISGFVLYKLHMDSLYLDQHYSNRSWAIRTIQWVCISLRPLTATELTHALAVGTEDEELSEDDNISADHLVEYYGGLIVTEPESKYTSRPRNICHCLRALMAHLFFEYTSVYFGKHYQKSRTLMRTNSKEETEIEQDILSAICKSVANPPMPHRAAMSALHSVLGRWQVWPGGRHLVGNLNISAMDLATFYGVIRLDDESVESINILLQDSSLTLNTSEVNTWKTEPAHINHLRETDLNRQTKLALIEAIVEKDVEGNPVQGINIYFANPLTRVLPRHFDHTAGDVIWENPQAADRFSKTLLHCAYHQTQVLILFSKLCRIIHWLGTVNNEWSFNNILTSGLYLAVEIAHKTIMDLLDKAKVEQLISPNRMMILHHAATLLELDRIYLVAEDEDDDTPLHLVAMADITDGSIKNKRGLTPLEVALDRRCLMRGERDNRHTRSVQNWLCCETDIVQVALCLQYKYQSAYKSSKSACAKLIRNNLCTYVLGTANYWIETKEWDDPSLPFLISKPVPGSTSSPVQRIVFHITSHNQSYANDRNARTSSFSNPSSRENTTIPTQDPNGHNHRIAWGTDAFQPGNAILVKLMALFPGWHQWYHDVEDE
ncbi:hypothetical protein F5Y16DRAFT_414154 [Xylariaceae sp. FL0255]|nr:hypothetical protein F5Y16DRAFT_414154 [Xylariaceae sp. FL0255]